MTTPGTALPVPPSREKFHYAWVAAAVTFLTLLTAAGARAVSGVILLPVGNEFQWSRAAVSSIISVNIFLYGMMGPFAAALYQRFGLRATMAVAMVLVAIGYGLLGFARHYWEFVFLWGMVVGGGAGLAATVLAATVSSRWFTVKRGLVMGALTASTATGQLVFLPQLAAVATHLGWRAAPHLMAWTCAALVPVIIVLMRNYPQDMGRRPYGEPGAPDPSEATQPRQNPITLAFRTLAQAVRVRDFWILSGSFFICGASTNGLIGTHLISAAFDCGIPETKSAGLLAAMGIFDLVGTTLSGWLSDRFDSRYLLFNYYLWRGLALLFLPHALIGTSTELGIFVVFYGLDWIATVPPTVRLCRNAFGPERAGIVFGWVAAVHQLGAAFAAFTAGGVRTWTGSYNVAFWGAGLLCAAAAFGVLTIRKEVRPSAAIPGMAPA